MKERATHLTLLCLGLFLFTFVISVVKPGLPATLKADEPAYFLLAMSLLHDGDTVAETRDYRRLFSDYPHLPTENLILMSNDGWETVRYGKPYLYPLLTVPLVALWGANGMVAFNTLCFVALLWMGAVYLGRYNPEPVAILFSIAFFFLSPTFAYVFWLQPELLNMASVMASLFVVYHRFERPSDAGSRLTRIWRRIFNESTRPAWSGALLAFGGYNKPVLAIVAVPILYTLWRRGGWKPAAHWCAASLLGIAALAAGSVALTGQPTAYLGAARAGVKVEDPEAMGAVIADLDAKLEELSTTANSWTWMFDMPPFGWRDFFERLGYFFWGRHTGILLYTPFTLVALVLLLIHRRRDVARWLMFGALIGLGVFFLVKIPLNWHGGAGFVGNRYLINIYPLVLFTVTVVRPRWLLPAACAVGGLFLGSIVFTPFGAPVPKPTIQAHVRSLPYRYFPLELSLRRAVPGYEVAAFRDLTLIGRKDVFKFHQPEKGNLWLQGGTPVELHMLASKPLGGLFFEVRTWAPDNVVELDLAGDKKTVEFVDAERNRQRSRVVELTPQEPRRKTYELAQATPYLVYDFTVEIAAGRRIVDAKNPNDIFFLGAQIQYLGRRDQITEPKHYRLKWLAVDAPATAAGAETFEITVEARNDCAFPIPAEGALAVRLSYHWLDEDGNRVLHGGRRTDLLTEVPVGDTFTSVMTIRAPNQPGTYRLELDAVREGISWFSELGGETRDIPIEVTPAADDATSSAP